MSSDSDDEMQSLAALKAKVVKAKVQAMKKATAAAELSSSDDDGDEISLAALKKKAILKKKAKAPRSKTKVITAKRSKPIKQPASKRKKKAAARKSASSAGKSKSTSSSSSTGSDDSYMEVFRTKSFRVTHVSKKHLVEGILIRWKYVLEWPPRSAILPEPPKGHIMLRGYPGVYIGIHGVHCGHLLDNRQDRTNIPSYDNLIKKSPDTLKSMLIDAIGLQLKELKENDGPQHLEESLELELKNAGKVNASRLSKK